MSRKTKPNLRWRCISWRPSTSRGIERRVKRHRNLVAHALGLDDPIEIDAALKDLTVLLIRTVAFIRDVDRTASVAQQRVNLRALNRRGDFTLDTLEGLDPATYNRIIAHYPRGALGINVEGLDEGLLRNAVSLAIEELGAPRRGRSPETDSLALRQFALGLADVFARHAGRPGRRVDWLSGKESGPFHDFVSVVFGLLPFNSGPPKGISYITKLAAAERKKAPKSGDVTRLWALDDSLYLGKPRQGEL